MDAGRNRDRGWNERSRLSDYVWHLWDSGKSVAIIAEGLAFMERALALSTNVAPSVRAMALHSAGFLALMQDDSMRAEDFLR